MPPVTSGSINLTGLQKLYQENTAASDILDHFANRERNQNTSFVRRLMHNLAKEDSACSRGEVIRALKELSRLGIGEFKAGRKGHESRFLWSVSSKSAGEVAAGEATEIDEEVPSVDDDTDEVDDELLTHPYPLRRDLVVSFDLPPDLTMREAKRLARFIETLPFSEDVEE